MSCAGSPQGAKAPLGGLDVQTPSGRSARLIRRPVHGVLLLDKPLGWSSNDALQKARRLLRAEKAGHTGTLDPLASGVLPLCFGAATKFSQVQLDADKTYEATVRLGVTTQTGDAEGAVLQTRAVNVTDADVARVVRQFTGDISQIPPMHSALKKDGRAMYDYARAGLTVERAPRAVQIYDLKVLQTLMDKGREALFIRVSCSKGTYIRTLAEDIGEALGCGAHLTALRRIGTGGFDISQCLTLQALEALPETQRLAQLQPVETLLAACPCVTLNEEHASRFLNGVPRRGDWADALQVAVLAQRNRQLLGTARIHNGELIPLRLLSPTDIEQIQQARGAPTPEVF